MWSLLTSLLWTACAPPPPAPGPLAPTDDHHEVDEAWFPHCFWGLDPGAGGVFVAFDAPGGLLVRVYGADARRHAGFEDGDRLLAVNGHWVGDADADARARVEMRGARRCVWQVARHGEERVFSADIAPAEAWAPEEGVITRAEVFAIVSDPYRRVEGSFWRDRAQNGVHAALATRVGAVRGERLVAVNAARVGGLDSVDAAWTAAASGDSVTFVLEGEAGERRVPMRLGGRASPAALPPKPWGVPNEPAGFAAYHAARTDDVLRVSETLYLVKADWLTPERFFFEPEGIRYGRYGHMVLMPSEPWAAPLGLRYADFVTDVGSPIYDERGGRLPTITLDREFEIRFIREGRPSVIRYRVVDRLPTR